MVGRSAAPSRRRPRPLVALPWGSRSTTSTRFSEAASEAARFTAVVVLSTPPFWFATARIRAMAPSGAVREGAAVTRARAGDQPALDQLDQATPSTILRRGSDNRSLRQARPPLFHVERAGGGPAGSPAVLRHRREPRRALLPGNRRARGTAGSSKGAALVEQQAALCPGEGELVGELADQFEPRLGGGGRGPGAAR